MAGTQNGFLVLKAIELFKNNFFHAIMKEYPKVLLVCNFNQRTANGITIKNLFRHWPKDKIAVAAYNTPAEHIFAENIEQYYVLGHKEFNYIFPFNFLASKQKSQPMRLTKRPKSKIGGFNQKHGNGILAKTKSILASIKAYLIHASGVSLILEKYKMSSEFENWINDFSPEVIYSSTSSIGNMNFIRQIKKKYNKKLVFHVFDDFLNSGNTVILPGLRTFWLRQINYTYKALIEFTNFDFAISQKMATNYENLYNKKYYPFHNPIDEEIWLREDPLNKSKQLKYGFVFVYTGKVNRDTAPGIKLFLRTLNDLNKSGYKLELHVYTQTEYEHVYALLGSLAQKVFKGCVENQNLPPLLKNANALLFTLSFEQKSIKYTILSIATKTTEYMISGSPIFVFAPAELAVTEYLSEHNAAFIVSNNRMLRDSIITFINNSELRRTISQNAYSLAKNYHLSINVSERLRKLLLNQTSDL